MFSLVLYIMLFVSCGEPVSIKRHIDKNEECGQIEGNILKSPKFPQNYPKNIHCVYTIPVMKNKAVKLNFGHFDIESSEGCSYDYLEVRDIENSYGKYCEHNLQGESMVIDDTPVVNIIFHSDKVLSKKGFEMKYEYLNKGPEYGGQALETFTIKSTDASFTPRPTSRNPNPNPNPTKPSSSKETSISEKLETTLPSKTEQKHHVVPSTTKPFSNEKPFHRSTHKPIATSQTEVETTPTERLTETDLKTTSEARTDDLTTNEPNVQTSEAIKLTEASPTSETHVETVKTTESNIPKPTSRGPNTEGTSKATPKPNETIRGIPEIPGKRQKKQMISNDNSGESPVTTSSKPNSISPTTSLAFSVKESLPTKLLTSNKTLLSSNVTGNESEPTKDTEMPITTEKMSTLLPTTQPEQKTYKPESEYQVLDRLKLMVLIQRIKFNTLKLEELLIGRLLEEEIHEAKANNELKREVDDFTDGIGSYLDFRERSKREVQRDFGKDLIDRIRRKFKTRKEKKSYIQ